jgi:hypothetical protein
MGIQSCQGNLGVGWKEKSVYSKPLETSVRNIYMTHASLTMVHKLPPTADAISRPTPDMVAFNLQATGTPEPDLDPTLHPRIVACPGEPNLTRKG